DENIRLQLRCVEDGRDVVPALAQDLLLNALLSFLRQDLVGPQLRAVLRDDDEHLSRRHIVEEHLPQDAQQEQQEERGYADSPEQALPADSSIRRDERAITFVSCAGGHEILIGLSVCSKPLGTVVFSHLLPGFLATLGAVSAGAAAVPVLGWGVRYSAN